MDIGIALERIRPGAQYRRYDTYAALAATWEDSSTLPTLAELEAAYNAYVAETSAAKTEDTSIKTAAELALRQVDVLLGNLDAPTFATKTPAEKTEILRSGLFLALKAIKYIHRKMPKEAAQEK